ncbi:hypothetical protein J6590_004813 [Homalodisca vitripennis]|nr:hypothetical protein J6590_004813 [Homalodisca vitripennis]
MDTELYISTSSTNNNPPVKKKWSTSSIPGLESLEEVMETGELELPPSPPTRQFLGLEDKRGRRKSWHTGLGKFEKKRRKSAAIPGTASPPAGEEIKYHRQKRPSWWTIFVPDNFNPKSSNYLQSIYWCIVNTPQVEADVEITSFYVAEFELPRLQIKVYFDSIIRWPHEGREKAKSVFLTP